jgi:hypothetical protein
MQRHKALTHSLLAGLAVLNLTVANIAHAGPNTVTRGPHGAAYIQTMDASFPKMAAKYGMSVTPFNLVFLAFQGFFASEGIPSAQALMNAYQSGKVTPEALIKAAIAMHRLPAETLQDKEYLANVKSQLETLNNSN